MQFSLDADLAEVADLAARIFADKGDPAAIRKVEAATGPEAGFDADLWRVLADADLVGLALPEQHGGSGLGMLGLVAVLEQQGRRVAPVPLWSVVTLAAQPLASYGTDAQRAAWLQPLLTGRTVVTGAFEAAADGSLPVQGTAETAAGGTAGSWRLTGHLAAVPAGAVAAAVLVPFATPDGLRVALVPADRAGCTVTPVSVTSHENAADLDLRDVVVTPEDLLTGDGGEIVDRTRTRARIALGALATGVTQEAIAITAAYTSQRHQFGRPLSTNQAVALRAADAHLDSERIRLTTYKAAWHADRGEEDEARAAALVAKWWTATGGLRAVHATQHLHGGIGADVDYPIHRYFLWGRQLAFTLGTAGAVEAELADLLPTVAPIGASA